MLGLITEVTGFLRGLNFFLLLIALLAIVVYVLIALPIQIHLMYEGKGKRHSLLLRFQIFNGRIGVGTKFLFGQQIESDLPKLSQVKKTGIKLFSRFKRTSRRRNIHSLNEVKFYYLTVKKFINFIKVFMRHSVCKRFAWDTTVGLKDYAATGIATGLLWALKGYIIGVYYSDGDDPPSIKDYALAIQSSVDDCCRKWGYPRPSLIVEPGRSIISPAGTTIYTIGGIKDIPGIRKYVAVDGGMTDNPRVALYQAKYEGLIANKADIPVQEVVSVTGRCCESGDMLIWDLAVPKVEPGDLLAISCTGAYNYSMSSNYNGLPRPALVLVKDGSADLIVERETYEDLRRQHRIPPRLLGTCRQKG